MNREMPGAIRPTTEFRKVIGDNASAAEFDTTDKTFMRGKLIEAKENLLANLTDSPSEIATIEQAKEQIRGNSDDNIKTILQGIVLGKSEYLPQAQIAAIEIAVEKNLV